MLAKEKLPILREKMEKAEQEKIFFRCYYNCRSFDTEKGPKGTFIRTPSKDEPFPPLWSNHHHLLVKKPILMTKALHRILSHVSMFEDKQLKCTDLVAKVATDLALIGLG